MARRKARRRLSKLLVYTATSLIVGVLVIVGGWWLYDGYRQHQSNIAYLNDTLSLIAETDEAINRLDDLIADPFAVDSSDAYEEVESSLSEIEEKLDRADERAREASATLRESKAAEAAQQAIETISARYVLIDQGGRIVDAAERAYASIERAREAWDKLLSADASARESSDLVKDTTPENVRSSIDKANEALENFGEAERLFQEAQALYGVDFSMFGDYIAKREEALRYAITSDEAILAKDKVAAIKGNDLYNAADAQAAAYVKSLPDDPSSPVIDAYESDIDAFENAYSTARLQAGAADAFIRDYLGTEIK
ncbi:hypothetical protein B5F40_00090 [Gordonibacter sp. An230]|nr:hypothetical protein B5F40_00090 [Gordonibacter sp. An230]